MVACVCVVCDAVFTVWLKFVIIVEEEAVKKKNKTLPLPLSAKRQCSSSHDETQVCCMFCIEVNKQKCAIWLLSVLGRSTSTQVFNSLPCYHRCITFTCCCTELSALRVVGPQAFGRDSLCHTCAEVMQIISWSKTKLCMHACTHRGFKDPPTAGFRSTYCTVLRRFSWTLNQH